MPSRVRTLLQSRRAVRVGFALLSGIALAFSFPNVAWGWLAFFALTPLIASAVSARGKLEAFLLGWFAYTVTWLINIPWVIIVMSRYGGLSLPVGIAIFLALCLSAGGYGGAFALLVHLLRLGERFLPWLVVPAAWTALEYARTFWFSGFPWNLIATATIDLPPFAQPSRWLGAYGLGFLVVSVATTIAWLIITVAVPRRRLTVVSLLIAFVALWALVGGLLLRRQVSRIRTEKKYLAAMVQPNISQQMRWDERNLNEIFDRMARLTQTGFESRAEVVVWPESTIPLMLLDPRASFYRLFIQGTSQQYSGDMILGSVAEDPEDPTRLWNAAYLISRGSISGRYDKIRLVPFGEYVPLRKLFFFAEKLVREVGNFRFGTNDFPLIGKFKYGPAICYEVVYPQIPATQVANGAEVLVTITNDAWFGRSAAPRQHLNQARLRAVETDRYFLRAATTGISALIDPTGRVVKELDLEREGVIVGEFAPRQSETAYVRFGDWPAWVSIATAIIAVVLRQRGKKS